MGGPWLWENPNPHFLTRLVPTKVPEGRARTRILFGSLRVQWGFLAWRSLGEESGKF